MINYERGNKNTFFSNSSPSARLIATPRANASIHLWLIIPTNSETSVVNELSIPNATPIIVIRTFPPCSSSFPPLSLLFLSSFPPRPPLLSYRSFSALLLFLLRSSLPDISEWMERTKVRMIAKSPCSFPCTTTSKRMMKAPYPPSHSPLIHSFWWI